MLLGAQGEPLAVRTIHGVLAAETTAALSVLFQEKLSM